MYCPRCGALNLAYANYCAKCGTNITNPLYQPHPPVAPAYRQLPAQPVYRHVQYRQSQAQQQPYHQPAQPRYQQSGLHCRRCGSNNVRVEVINQVKLKDKRKGCFWWLFIGWWWVPVKWLCFTGWALLFKVFGHKEQEAVNVKRKICVCQNCGHSWYK